MALIPRATVCEVEFGSASANLVNYSHMAVATQVARVCDREQMISFTFKIGIILSNNPVPVSFIGGNLLSFRLIYTNHP
jgi:hypothetical protein